MPRNTIVDKIKLPNLQIHADIHAIVGNQLADNLEPVVRTVVRLKQEGLSGHDSIHVKATILVEYLNDLSIAEISLNLYYVTLDRLSAKSWLKGG